MKFSDFAAQFDRDSGILRLMNDLGEALDGRGRGADGGGDKSSQIQMLGGGNPAAIPAAQAVFRAEMARLLADADAFERMAGNYDAPQGNAGFIEALAEALARDLGWPVTRANIAVTNGSQSAFGILFNLFAGEYSGDGRGRAFKKILLPLTPEYIGYADVGLGSEPIFTANKPRIEMLDGGGIHPRHPRVPLSGGGDGDGGGDDGGAPGGDGGIHPRHPRVLLSGGEDGDSDDTGRFFKYRVDFDRVEAAIAGLDIGAVCISRPTNPTGNLVTDAEVAGLSDLTRAAGIPLIVDGAYGLPFPGIVFAPATPRWEPHMILCLSLSKLGLPGARTGIVIAAPEVIAQLAAANAIFSLAPGRFGPTLVTRLLKSGELTTLCADIIAPFYRRRARQAIAQVQSEMADLPVKIHASEGAIFLWLWFPGLPVPTETLYQRLKQRGVLVIAGRHFFPGMKRDWRHKHECIRVTFAADEAQVERGISIIADEVRRAYSAPPRHSGR